MPKILEHKEARMRRIIRDAMAIDPLIDLKGIVKAVEQKMNRTIDPRYVKRLLRSITGEMSVVADREKVEERISYLRERNRIICEELFRMAFPGETVVPRPTLKERQSALKAISDIEARQIKLEMDLGLFTRHLGQLDVDHRLKPMDEDTLTTVVKTFEAWSIPPQLRKIEPRKVITAQVKEIPHEPVKSTTSANVAPVNTLPITTGAGLVTTE
jgi:hypothetical protein